MNELNSPYDRDDMKTLQFALDYTKEKLLELTDQSVDIMALEIIEEVLNRAITDAYWSRDSR